MEVEGDYLVLRSPRRLEYHTKVCLAMKVDVTASAELLFHLVLERCRCVLFTCADHVLVSPQSDHFLMICDPAFPHTEQFQELARQICVVEAWASPVTSQVLAECLAYTLTARLAPEWNRVGGWLLQGEKFLHQAEPLNAVKMKVNVANEVVEVCVKATRVSFPLISPEELGISQDLLENFIAADDSCVLTERNFGQRTLHVLPSLTRARLISISKEIPPCPEASLLNWNSMKSYWKNMQGYRLGLEETDEPRVYFNLTLWNGLTFTYPEWTVRLAEPRPLPRTDPSPILDSFIKDLLACNEVVLDLQFCLVPLEPQEEAAAATTSYREEQQVRLQPARHSSLANFTEDQRRKVAAPVEQQVQAEARHQGEDSGYPTSRNPRATRVTTLPMTSDRMKPSFMTTSGSNNKRSQVKHSQPKTRFTRKIIPNYDPFAQAEAAAQQERSQKLLRELCAGKEEKKSNKMDEEFMTF